MEAASAFSDKTKIPKKQKSGAGQTMNQNAAKCWLLVAVGTLS